MKVFSEEELQLVNIHIGLSIKLDRLKKGLSQLDFADTVETSNTAIGRIERAEHYSSWDKVLILSQHLGLNFSLLFLVKTKDDLLNLIDECYKLEDKLTKEKKKYYTELRKRIELLYKKIAVSNNKSK